jgi:transcriptional regulator with XRE-family HTH domain
MVDKTTRRLCKVVAENVYQLRRDRAFTRHELAQRMGAQKSLIGEAEKGTVQLATRTLARLAVALEVATHELLTPDGWRASCNPRTANASTTREFIVVPENVRRLRRLGGWTQRQLAARMDATESAVRRYESEPTELANGTLVQLAAALEAPIRELLISGRARERCAPRATNATTNAVSRDVGENVYRLRSLRRWTKKQLAERMDANESEVTRYESGAKHLRLGTLVRIATALEVEAHVLLMPAARTPKRRPGRPRKQLARR